MRGIIIDRTVLPVIECCKFLIVYIAPECDGNAISRKFAEVEDASSSPVGGGIPDKPNFTSLRRYS